MKTTRDIIEMLYYYVWYRELDYTHDTATHMLLLSLEKVGKGEYWMLTFLETFAAGFICAVVLSIIEEIGKDKKKWKYYKL